MSFAADLMSYGLFLAFAVLSVSQVMAMVRLPTRASDGKANLHQGAVGVGIDIVTGKALSEKRVARAVELSAEKYCSASIMLGKTATITHDYEIREG